MQASSIVSRGDHTTATPEMRGRYSASSHPQHDATKTVREAFLLHPRLKFLHDFAKLLNKIGYKQPESRVSDAVLLVGFEKRGNMGNISTSCAPNGQRDPAFSQRIAHP